MGTIILCLAVILIILLTIIFWVFWYRKSLKIIQSGANLLDKIINTSQDYIYVKDRELRIMLCNETSARFRGRSPSEMIGKTDIELGLDPDMINGDKEKGIRGFKQDDLAVLGGATVHSLTDIWNINGQIYFFDTIKVPLRDASGHIIGVIGTSRDVTESKRIEDNLRRSNQLLACISHLQNFFIEENLSEQIFNNLLLEVLELTKSEYGFIAELITDSSGLRYLQTLSISNISWNDFPCPLYALMGSGKLLLLLGILPTAKIQNIT